MVSGIRLPAQRALIYAPGSKMALPLQRTFLLPILQITANDAERRLSYQEILTELIPMLALSEEDLRERTPYGALRVEKHIRYAMHQLKQAGFLYQPAYKCYRITDGGLRHLEQNPEALHPAQLNMLAAEREQREGVPSAADIAPTVGDISPDEHFEVTYEQLQARLADELLDSIKTVSPERFEDLVVELLVKIGYGRGRRVGRSGDGGIDGVVTQDRLGFERVYIQAKRWDKAQVGEPEIRTFSGSLDPHGATRGVFITTSRFSEAAQRTAAEVARNNKTILLIDGPKLAKLMIEYEVGVVVKAVYKIKEIDENYFADS